MFTPVTFAARPVEAAHEAELDRIATSDEDNRDCGGCCHSRENRRCAAGRDNHSYFSANQLGSNHLQSIVLTVRPAEFDCHVLAFDEAGCFQAVAERSDKVRKWRGRGAAHEPDDRYRFLCVRDNWPRNRAAEERDELAPSQLIELQPIPPGYATNVTTRWLLANAIGVCNGLGILPRVGRPCCGCSRSALR